MFVARSAARIRFARVAFLVVGLAPAAGLVAWAARLRGDAHRAAIERRWQGALGIPLAVGTVEHPRPGVIRGRGCSLPAAAGRGAITLPLVEVESSADEDRIRIDRFSCDAAAAAVIAGLAREWLADEVRFRRTCIVEVADFTWSVAPPPDGDGGGTQPLAPLRVECVARPGRRAVRIVRQLGETGDEVRIVRGPSQVAADVRAATDQHGTEPPITVAADCREAVPLVALMVAAGGDAAAATACGSATVAGVLEATWTDAGWSGSARGRIEGVDLAAAAAAVGGRAGGRAAVDVTRLEWREGRVTDALLEAVAGPGLVDGRLFDRVVMGLAARPGPAARPLPPGGERSFDAAACIVGVGPRGVQVLPAARLPTGLAEHGGEPLLLPPPAPVPADRIAWMLSAPGTAYAPAVGPGSWLISVLPPESHPPAAESGRQF